MTWVGVLGVTRLLFKGGIRLNGLPAPRADASRTPIRPFTQQDSRFTASHPTILNELTSHHRQTVEWTFRFCAGAGLLSPRPFTSVAVSAWWTEFPQCPLRVSEAARQLTNQ